jgi:SAM-dependent methyltransferase
MSDVRRPWTLSDVLMRRPRLIYDFAYRRGAPWDGGPRRELVDLVDSGALTPQTPGPRAIDLGCGTGANVAFLSRHGFDAMGIDISPVAIEQARENASASGVDPRFETTDVMDPTADLGGPFDLLLDGGMVDDFPRSLRPGLASRIAGLARPGSVFITWCFYAYDRQLPAFSLSGPSRRGSPGFEPEEFDALYRKDWEIDLLSGGVDHRFACFRLTRRPPDTR